MTTIHYSETGQVLAVEKGIPSTGVVLPIRRALPGTELGRAPAIQDIDPYGALLADASNPRTHRARVQDVADLALYLGTADPRAACRLVLSGSAGHANTIALGYKRSMVERELSANTINRRLSTVRHLVKLARRLGMVDWSLDVDSLKAESYRDTTGPGDDGWRKLLATTSAAGDGPKARRDRALLRLLHDNALRREEVVSLDIEDVDLSGARVAVIGKGRTQRRWLTLNEPTVEALRAWLEARGSISGPLFINFAPMGRGRAQRLAGDGLHDILGTIGRRSELGRPVRPHALRHAGVTRALELTNGNVRMVQKFSRHLDANTVAVYDDNREDLAGRVAKLLGADA